MALTPADALAIKAELENDPLDLGLTTLAADDEANANILNLVRVEIQIDRETVPASDIAKAIDRDEYNAASAADRQYIEMVTAGGSVNPKAGSEVREALLQIFGAGTESRTNLTALLTESGSRFNQLHKLGTISRGGNITPSEVAQARQAT